MKTVSVDFVCKYALCIRKAFKNEQAHVFLSKVSEIAPFSVDILSHKNSNTNFTKVLILTASKCFY